MLFCGFINSITEQSKYCSEMMKKHFNKEIVMAKNIMKILRNLFKKPTKGWICNNTYVYGDIKVRNHYHINGNYRRSTDRDCDINIKTNRKILVIFHNLKN